MNTLLIYHNEDNDGLFSAAIIYNYLISKKIKTRGEISRFGANYNMLKDFAAKNTMQDLKEKYDTIILTDISFEASYMKKLYNEYGNHFIWFDHHAPIIKESYIHDFNGVGVRNPGKSAILCAFEYYYDPLNANYNDKFVPELFRILSGWDSWSFEREGYTNDYVKKINKAVTTIYRLDFDKIVKVVNHLIDYWEKYHSVFDNEIDIDKLHEYGTTIVNYEDVTMEDIIKTSGDCSWKVRFEDEDRGRPLYHSACAIFHQGASNSTMFKSLINKGIQHGLVFKHAPNGNWTMSMYNVDDNEWTHCGEFLKERYGGGGHKGAAGCTFTQDQFIEILKKKEL